MQLLKSSSLSDLASESCSLLPATTSSTTTFTGNDRLPLILAFRTVYTKIDFDDLYNADR